MVRLLKPQTLLEAFEIAQIQEQSLEAVIKNGKWGQKSQAEPDPRFVRKTWNATKSNAAPKVAPTGDTGEGKEGIKKISPQELQYRRNNNLCYKCGEKFGPEHQCKLKQFNFMISDDDTDVNPHDDKNGID